MTSSLTLPKIERLHSKKYINLLFKEGKSLFVHPIKLMYLKTEHAPGVPPLQVAFSVPKRNFKKATDRNLLKRRMREAYRLNKTPLLSEIENSGNQYIWMFIYVHKDLSDQKTMQQSMIRLNKLFINSLRSPPNRE